MYKSQSRTGQGTNKAMGEWKKVVIKYIQEILEWTGWVIGTTNMGQSYFLDSRK